MTNPRTYGIPPFTAALVHGGPGAAGELAPAARVLSASTGILEPLQTEATVEGQVFELAGLLRTAGQPVTLAGHSWGAWLSVLAAARYPRHVRKLILIGSGPFEERYADGIMDIRLARLTPAEREEVSRLGPLLADPVTGNDPDMFARFGALMEEADTCEPDPDAESPTTDFRPDIFHTVWPEAARLRRSGRLLDAVRRIRCPVVVIHGDYDPHPAAGVTEPLGQILPDFRFHLLTDCGHTPWKEKRAREPFYEIMIREISPL